MGLPTHHVYTGDDAELQVLSFDHGDLPRAFRLLAALVERLDLRVQQVWLGVPDTRDHLWFVAVPNPPAPTPPTGTPLPPPPPSAAVRSPWDPALQEV
jgi:hypothetical protein